MKVNALMKEDDYIDRVKGDYIDGVKRNAVMGKKMKNGKWSEDEYKNELKMMQKNENENKRWSEDEYKVDAKMNT
ncbi:hypothetical protein CEXT_330621 [Caerostris extrusa]|uniref:Uncharacterized protein n=1 Tax=Caerostris extrusa TaxID=172846 RepID=A0AAV4N501_CAEEX|nr:hypothetical protein CEXT_330621 [Caerostris extrusa]